jgi:erythromycin esterase
MWANWETAAFAQWLRAYNSNLLYPQKTGFYGLDMYSLFESLESVSRYLEKNDPAAFETAKKAMRCFEPYGDEGQTYARATALVPGLCENEVTELLTQIRRNITHYDSDPEHAFSTEQNALVAVNAEKYYRSMLRGGAQSWNIRDRYMVDTLERLMEFHGPGSKAIIWEHNTHIGDARATDMADAGMLNTGQLIREKYGKEDVVLVGFGSYSGSVIAGEYWGGPMKVMQVPDAVRGCWEDLLHHTANGNTILFSSDLKGNKLMEQSFGHRAIGVVYDPDTERFGNYVPSVIPERYDAFIFLDETTPLHPLHITPDGHQMPETYPFGM